MQELYEYVWRGQGSEGNEAPRFALVPPPRIDQRNQRTNWLDQCATNPDLERQLLRSDGGASAMPHIHIIVKRHRAKLEHYPVFSGLYLLKW